ncbi:unnamed protein product [Vitrella brassicaformis CCMP3155]|uniref:LRAT domain-containing protein n=1 Tax=Vitrella brassicaformis (strain CCMP3155) TaxID=1169540 RepID=A0A0G4ESY4_VITBC|nr:unnamed protein product [Vitrella brassicaformis CCMP3155]|eukprot:CEM01521.1 unnamed protein product [Vitrella brassicaformis CCMP3155]
MQLVSRPANPPCNPSSPGESCEHRGVVVTLVDSDVEIRYGDKGWLIHKGERYGFTEGDTIVRSVIGLKKNRWNFRGEVHQAVRGVSVGDLRTEGGTKFDFETDNCHHAVERMMAKALAVFSH